ncbi:MAG TPA: hypothetical protein VIL74_20150 [Pyrinomonadaceae bacterium]|jgi:hypothetical protein
MKLFFLVLFVSLLTAGGALSSPAQTSNTGKIAEPKVTRTAAKRNAFDISTVDFKNYTFPDFGITKTEKTFTLTNGRAESRDQHPKYTLRKTYYFDLTDDEQDEAITHVIADGCQMGCDSSNLFYIYTTENARPKLLWKIANAGDILGGLKAIKFNSAEIVVEVFGDCAINNSIITPNVDPTKSSDLKTTNYTRFVFSRSGDRFTQTARELIPLPREKSYANYRSQIIFGEEL